MVKIHTEAKIEKLPEVLGQIDAELSAAGCPESVQMQIDIAVEEIFVNISNYAYPDSSGTADIEVNISEGDPPVASIRFEDSGIPFDPLAKADPDITLSAEERAIGGLGIYMVKMSMDEVHYEYTGGRNCFSMSKKLADG